MKLPPIELLESVHKFPGPYIFKIIAHNNEETLNSIVRVIQQTLHLTSSPPFSSRISEGGKHASLTVEVVLPKAQDVHSVYEALLKTQGVILLL
ncbi:MAG: DUF493 family protein [Deltaproteobacteria bacterium]